MFTELSGGNRDDFEVYVVAFDANVTAEKGPEAFWKSVCKRFHTTAPKRFPFDVTKSADSETFMRFFSKGFHPSSKPAIVIIDEASRLTSVGGTISEAAKVVTDQFISTLRSLKNAHFLLHSIALVGTASIRELLIVHNKPGASSQISPFTEEATWAAGRFTKEEVRKLFDEFAQEVEEIESADISADIFELTLGHRGLVGSCGAFIQRTYDQQAPSIKTADEWKKMTTVDLWTFISEKQHYDSIMRSLDHLTPECKSILTGVLRYGAREVNLVGYWFLFTILILIFNLRSIHFIYFFLKKKKREKMLQNILLQKEWYLSKRIQRT